MKRLLGGIDRYVVMVVLLIITAMILPVVCKLFSFLDIWIQIAGSVLGIVFAAVITSVMLKWQTRTEAEQERDSKVYEQKLVVCLDFLKEICEILQDGKVTAEEANRLRFDFANIAIHLSEKSLVSISDSLGLIVESCGGVSNNEGEKDDSTCLEKHVMDIVSVIRSEMYGTCHTSDSLKIIIENLTRISNQVEEYSGKGAATAESQVDLDGNKLLFDALAQQLQGELAKGWYVRNQNGVIRITSEHSLWNTPEKLHISLAHDNPDFHYYQCHVDLPEENGKRRKLYMPMRTELGGRLNKYCWWRRLGDKYEQLLASTARSDDDTSELLLHLKQELLRIVSYMERFIHTDCQMRYFQEQTTLTPWVWSVWGNQGIVLHHRENEGVVCDFVCDSNGRYTAVRLRLRELDPMLRHKCLELFDAADQNAESVILANDVPDKETMSGILKKLMSALP